MRQSESGTQNDLIEHRLRIAKEDLDTAYLLLNAKQYRGANNRAYYSIYHTIDAILSVEGIGFKRHKDTLAYFNKQYIASRGITLQQIETAERLFYMAKDYYNEKCHN